MVIYKCNEIVLINDHFQISLFTSSQNSLHYASELFTSVYFPHLLIKKVYVSFRIENNHLIYNFPLVCSGTPCLEKVIYSSVTRVTCSYPG